VQPLAGRKLWLVGIGGTGMSALAALAHAWGAEVAGSDRELTPYAKRLQELGIEVVVGHSAENLRPGWEVVVSSAILPGNPELVEGARRRGELLAELVSLRPSIVVAGAHGKTTTTAMIAFVLDRLGLDPAFLIGGAVPQLGGNARAGEGWLVAEGDESDRSLALLAPKVAVVTNVDLDHHVSFGSLAEVERFFDEWLRSLPEGATVIRGAEVDIPDGLELAVPGEHNRRNAACALAALQAVGVDPSEAREALAEYRGAGRRFEAHGGARGVRVFDDYGHHPAEVAAALATARETAGPEGRVFAILQPHLYSRTRYLHRELAEALTAADVACVTEVCGAREEPMEGVTGRLVLDDLARLRPGMEIAWAPGFADVAAVVAARAREGDVVVTHGCGDIYRAIPGILDRLRT
jgi:UDP-N-acetylmuramate--alanine ligase